MAPPPTFESRAMYHAIVKHKIRAIFARINAGDWQAMT